MKSYMEQSFFSDRHQRPTSGCKRTGIFLERKGGGLKDLISEFSKSLSVNLMLVREVEPHP